MYGSASLTVGTRSLGWLEWEFDARPLACGALWCAIFVVYALQFVLYQCSYSKHLMSPSCAKEAHPRRRLQCRMAAFSKPAVCGDDKDARRVVERSVDRQFDSNR